MTPAALRLTIALAASALALAAEGCAPATPDAPAKTVEEAKPLPSKPKPEIHWVRNTDGQRRVRVEVVGANAEALRTLVLSPEDWSRILRVTVAHDLREDQAQSILGSYRVVANVLRFEPRFPLDWDLHYRAELDPVVLDQLAGAASGLCFSPAGEPASTDLIVAEFSLPKPKAERSTAITAVYPSGDVLPENLLRLYLHFSAPMSRGEAYRRVRVLDAKGRPLVFPFVELDEELWDPSGTRLTLLFDPGRIKSGLKPREELGPILESGKTYALVIDRDWPDSAGNPLRDSFRKTFRAGPAVETALNPKDWAIRPPTPGTRDPLILTFPAPLDHALLGRLIAVKDANGQFVPGRIEIADRETVWRFHPDSPWSPGRYSLVIDEDLEDLAGNSIAGPFEVDVFKPIERRPAAKTVTVPFRVGRGDGRD